jgi:hypothetical protein
MWEAGTEDIPCKVLKVHLPSFLLLLVNFESREVNPGEILK